MIETVQCTGVHGSEQPFIIVVELLKEQMWSFPTNSKVNRKNTKDKTLIQLLPNCQIAIGARSSNDINQFNLIQWWYELISHSVVCLSLFNAAKCIVTKYEQFYKHWFQLIIMIIQILLCYFWGETFALDTNRKIEYLTFFSNKSVWRDCTIINYELWFITNEALDNGE